MRMNFSQVFIVLLVGAGMLGLIEHFWSEPRRYRRLKERFGGLKADWPWWSGAWQFTYRGRTFALGLRRRKGPPRCVLSTPVEPWAQFSIYRGDGHGSTDIMPAGLGWQRKEL